MTFQKEVQPFSLHVAISVPSKGERGEGRMEIESKSGLGRRGEGGREGERGREEGRVI